MAKAAGRSRSSMAEAQAAKTSAANTAPPSWTSGLARNSSAPSPASNRAMVGPYEGQGRLARARPVRASTSGYSQTSSNSTGARKALKAPPSTPPSATQR